MGATGFCVTATGVSARDAFINARDEALYEHGHGGYTGSIAEKSNFIMLSIPPDMSCETWATIVDESVVYYGETEEKCKAEIKKRFSISDELVNKAFRQNLAVCDKWGPAGCFDLGGGRYCFFGMASC